MCVCCEGRVKECLISTGGWTIEYGAGVEGEHQSVRRRRGSEGE